MTQKLVTKKELKTVFGVPYSFAHIARLEAAGQFPTRVRLGVCRVAWYADEIEEWIASRPRIALHDSFFERVKPRCPSRGFFLSMPLLTRYGPARSYVTAGAVVANEKVVKLRG